MSPPGKGKGRPHPGKRPPSEAVAPDQTPGLSLSRWGYSPAEAAAWRCWTWRALHGCGCGRAADCQLWQPVPVHAEQPCPGMYGGSGRWQPCCRGAA
jgi:hypothetical protein